MTINACRHKLAQIRVKTMEMKEAAAVPHAAKNEKRVETGTIVMED